MSWLGAWQSVVHRLVAALVAGGLVISAGLGVLELRHAQTALQLETAQRTVLTVRHLQSLLRHFRDADADDPGPQVKRLLSIFTDGRPVRASRVRFPGSNRVWSWGPWPEADADYTAMHLWPFPEHAMSAGDEVSLDRLTLVQAPFNLGGRVCLVELLVDGPSARQRMRNAVFDHLATQWLLLALMTLLGLLLLRRWVLGPLLDVVALLGQSAQPEAYRRLARRQRGEFRRLAHSIADTLDRLEATSRQLAQRERAFQSLYQLAPSAMISLDPAGRVVEANRRAAALLGAASPSELIGRRCIELIRPEDRPRLQEAIDRLLSRDDPVRCQLRLDAPGHAVIHAAVEAAAVRDEEGAIQSVRLTLLDISRDHQHQRQLEDQSRLLSLMLDHLNDAVLLVDPQGRIAAFNRKLIGLVHCSPESLRGTPYRPEEFWEELGVRDPDLFAHRLRHMEAESQRPCQERFQTRRGAFVIHSIPVPQGDAEQTARLWVVQEAAPQEPSEHLSQQRRRRLQVLKRIGQSLNQTRDEEQVLQLAAGQVRDLLGVDAAGVAIRRHGRHSRSRQLIDQGPHACHLRTGQLLVRAIEESLLPLVLHQQDVAFWPDVPSSTRWGKAMAMAGYTCLAAGPLQGLHETWGMVWIACRAGRRLDPAQLQLLEALMPLLSARMQVAALEDQLKQAALTDEATDLPNRDLFDRALKRIIANHPQEPCSLILLEVDSLNAWARRWGFPAADAAMRQLAQRVSASCRRPCFLARISTTRLAILMPHTQGPQVSDIAHRLLQTIASEPITVPDHPPAPVTASLGAASFPEEAPDAQHLLALAQTRLERAVRSGRNRVVDHAPPAADRRAG